MQAEEELIYGFDPLCGWCFAFGPTIRALAQQHPDLPIQLRYAGLVLGERVQPIAATRDYLIRGLADVQRVSGVRAGAAFLNGLLAEGSYISNSEPPCRAIYSVEQLAPHAAFAFAVALPDAFYVQGLALDAPQVLAELASQHGLDQKTFVEFWESTPARLGTQAAFAGARAQGINSYPTLIYRRGAMRSLVARGFLPPREALARLEDLRSGRDA